MQQPNQNDPLIPNTLNNSIADPSTPGFNNTTLNTTAFENNNRLDTSDEEHSQSSVDFVKLNEAIQQQIRSFNRPETQPHIETPILLPKTQPHIDTPILPTRSQRTQNSPLFSLTQGFQSF